MAVANYNSAGNAKNHTKNTLGTKGYLIDSTKTATDGSIPAFCSDSVDLPEYKRLVCTNAGNVTFVPAQGDDADPITMAVTVGMELPWLVRRVFATGLTAKMRTVERGAF